MPAGTSTFSEYLGTMKDHNKINYICSSCICIFTPYMPGTIGVHYIDQDHCKYSYKLVTHPLFYMVYLFILHFMKIITCKYMCLIFFNRLTFLGKICLIDQFPAYSTFHQINLRIIPPKKQKNDKMIDEFYANKVPSSYNCFDNILSYTYSATGILIQCKHHFIGEKQKEDHNEYYLLA